MYEQLWGQWQATRTWCGRALPPPVANVMIISTRNSCRVRAVFGVEKFKKVTPPPLDLGVSGRTRGGGARVRQLEGVDQHLDFVRCVFNPETVKQAREASVTRASPMAQSCPHKKVVVLYAYIKIC